MSRAKGSVAKASVLAVTSGKGGVGKTFFAANLAAAKVALKTELSSAAVVDLIEYGPAVDAIDAGAEGDDLRTALKVRVAWRFV